MVLLTNVLFISFIFSMKTSETNVMLCPISTTHRRGGADEAAEPRSRRHVRGARRRKRAAGKTRATRCR